MLLRITASQKPPEAVVPLVKSAGKKHAVIQTCAPLPQNLSEFKKALYIIYVCMLILFQLSVNCTQFYQAY